MFNKLSSEQRTAVCVAVKDQLQSIIQSPEDFCLVLSDLSADQRTFVLEALEGKTIELMSDENQHSIWGCLRIY